MALIIGDTGTICFHIECLYKYNIGHEIIYDQCNNINMETH